MLAPQELRKRKPELTELLTEQERLSLRIGSLWLLAQGPRAAELKERAGHWPPELMPV